MATNTFVGVPQPDSAHKPLLNLVDSARVGSRTSHGATLFASAAGTLTSAGGGKRCGRVRDRSPAEPAPSAGVWRLYQAERPRSRRQPSRGRPDRVSGGTRGAHPVRTRANFDSRLRDEQSEHAGGESLLSQDPVLTAEAWDHRGFGLQPSQATPASSATRPAYVSASCPSRPHHPADRRRPSGVPCIT
jgi:hypothetical protein